MFLKLMANPHAEGKFTRVKTFEPVPGQRYAVDAEMLYRRASLLNVFGPRNQTVIRALDISAYVMLCLGIAATFTFVWWMWVPALVVCSAMLLANRSLAGTLALKAAQKSSAAFLHLHSIGALWLVCESMGSEQPVLQVTEPGISDIKDPLLARSV